MEMPSSNLDLTTSFKGGLISLGLSAGLQLSTHEFPAPSLSLPKLERELWYLNIQLLVPRRRYCSSPSESGKGRKFSLQWYPKAPGRDPCC